MDDARSVNGAKFVDDAKLVKSATSVLKVFVGVILRLFLVLGS